VIKNKKKLAKFCNQFWHQNKKDLATITKDFYGQTFWPTVVAKL
jgi:hypothetical protein